MSRTLLPPPPPHPNLPPAEWVAMFEGPLVNEAAILLQLLDDLLVRILKYTTHCDSTELTNKIILPQV